MMKRMSSLIVVCFSVSGLCFAQVDLQNVAMINLVRQEPITLRMLKNEVGRMEKTTGRALSSQQKREVLDIMINERLAIQAAERDKVTISDTELNQQVQAFRMQMAQALGRQPDDREFTEQILKQTGLEMAAFREYLRRQLLVQKYLMTKKQDTIGSIRQPTDVEIRKVYEDNETLFVRPQTLRFSMIQVPYGPDQGSKSRAKTLADRLASEIGSNPSRFDEAAQRGKAAGSGYQAGDAGYLPRNQEARTVMGDEFVTAAFNLKQGEVSRLIEGKQGYQIIKVTETYDKKPLDLNDEYPLGAGSSLKDYIKMNLLNQKQQQVIEQVSQELVKELRADRLGKNTYQIFEKNIVW